MTTAQPAAGQAPLEEKDHCKFSSDQYHWLIEAGILTTDHRVELIGGQILTIPPMGDEHGDSIGDLNTWLSDRLGQDYVTRCQVTFRLAEGFTPDPDFVLLRYKEAGYRGENRPTVADVLLVIEVTDSSLARDLGLKCLAYARAGVPELWVVDIPHRQVHRLTRPSPEGYQERTTAGEEDIISPALVPSLQMPVRAAL
jgi:Uma2 family endonuclease